MWKAVALWALLAFFQPEVSAVISPGFDEKHLRVPSSIFNHDKTACEDFTYLTEDHDCTDIHSNNTEIQVKHCTSGTGQGTGVLVFQRVPVQARQRQDIYRVRMVGYELQLVPVHYCRNGLALAPYSVLLKGTYHLEVLHLYSNFSFAHHPHVLDAVKMPLVHFDLELASAEGPVGTKAGCAWDRHCPPCMDGRAPGRWVTRDPVGLALNTSCIVTPEMRTENGNPMCGNTTRHKLANTWQSKEKLHFQPYSCRLRSEQEIDVAACVNGRTFCFVGDSHMRHAYNGVMSLLQGSTAWHSPLSLAGSATKKTDKSVKEEVDFMRLINNQKGEVSWDSDKCTDVFANFGQWLAPSELERADSVHAYVSMLRPFIAHLLKLQETGIRVHWVTTNSFPLWRGTWWNPNRQDWRTDPVLLVYNRAANTMMENAKIPIIDTYSIATPLFDLSYDGAHYKGHVGYNTDLRFLNVICQPREIPTNATSASSFKIARDASKPINVNRR